MKSKFIILAISITIMTACTLNDSPPQIEQNFSTNNQSAKTASPAVTISPTPISQSPEKRTQAVKSDSSYEALFSSPINLTEATVSKIVDGDTVYVKIKNKSYKMRMVGINCPEYTKEIQFYGKESTEYAKNQLLGKKVYLEMDVSDTDQYDRMLRYIWLDIPTDINEQEIRSKLFNALLVIKGFARAGYYPPDLKYTNYLKDFEQEAKDSKLGMWSTIFRSQSPSWKLLSIQT